MTRTRRFLIGAIAKTVATVVTYPYVMAKSRMQMRADGTAPPPSSAWAMLAAIYRAGGIRALYAGLVIKLIQSVSRNALLFLFEDEVFKTLLMVVGLLKI